MPERPSRARRRPDNRRSNAIVREVFATALIGLFVFLGIGPLVHLIVRALPESETAVEIVGRDSRESFAAVVGRGIFSGGTAYYVTVRLPDGAEIEVGAPRDLYDVAIPGLRSNDDVILQRSVLFGIPTAMTVTTAPLANLPALGIEGEAEGRSYSLLLPLLGALMVAAFCFAIVGYLLIKLPRKREFHWPIFAGGVGLAGVLGVMWWL